MAMRKLGDGRVVSYGNVRRGMDSGWTKAVDSKFEVKVGLHQESVLSLLLFVIVRGEQ